VASPLRAAAIVAEDARERNSCCRSLKCSDPHSVASVLRKPDDACGSVKRQSHAREALRHHHGAPPWHSPAVSQCLPGGVVGVLANVRYNGAPLHLGRRGSREAVCRGQRLPCWVRNATLRRSRVLAMAQHPRRRRREEASLHPIVSSPTRVRVGHSPTTLRQQSLAVGLGWELAVGVGGLQGFCAHRTELIGSLKAGVRHLPDQRWLLGHGQGMTQRVDA